MLCRSGRPRNLYCYRSTGDVWASLYCKGLGLKVYNFNSNLFLELGPPKTCVCSHRKAPGGGVMARDTSSLTVVGLSSGCGSDLVKDS